MSEPPAPAAWTHAIPGPGGLAAGESARLLASDRAVRAAAQTRFDRPLVLEAGAGTGKTTTLIARLLAWCLGPGWERAAAAAAAAPREPAAVATWTSGMPAAASSAALDAIAARVLRRVVALTFTEAAAAEMAGRAARELLALARGAAPPDWLAPASLPPAGELAQRARALSAALDHLTVETIHAYCFRLLAAHPLAAGVHPRLRIDADGRLLQLVISETVESALQPGYGTPGDPHLLALAAQGCGPREVAEALAALADGGLPAAALAEDPFAGDGWPRLRRRIAAACADLLALLDAPLAGSRLRNAGGVLAGLRALAPRPAPGPTADLAPGPAWPAPEPAAAARAAGHAWPAPGLPAADRAPAPARRAPADPALAAGARADLVAAEIAAERLRLAAALPTNLRQHLDGWGRGRLGRREEASRLNEVRGELAAGAARLGRLLDHLDGLDPERLRHARLALGPLLARVEDELRRRGIATFDSLLRGARLLLASHAEVRAALRRAIDQLLVDEFQDTDATQCEVLRWIALDGPPDERPGLFLVGDPKQSIYGWRSADLRAYEGFVARVRDAGGEVLPLVQNFRSLPAVLAEVARIAVPVMRARPGVQPPFAPLVAGERRVAEAAGVAAGLAACGRAPVEHWISWLPAAPISGEAGGTGRAGQSAGEPSPSSAGDAAALEAAAIAADLLELRRLQGLRWRDAAILLRSTGDLEAYLDALRRAGIPFAVERDKQYYRRREVVDAAALVRAVLDPGDHLALVTVLRSPAVGVPDAALLPLWRNELPRLLTELHEPSGEHLARVRQAVEAAAGELPAGVPGLERVAGWELSLLSAIEQLAVLRESAAVEPADLFVERLRRLLLVDATAAARDLGAHRLANLDRFFRQLLVELEQGGGDVMAVLRALRDSVAAGREAEEGKPLEGGEEAVRVLTIHGAKGLDFAHVYLPQLHKPPGGERPATAVGRLAAAGGPDGCEYRLLGAATPGFDLVDERRREVEAAERVRTLYVAMTRAKDRLVMAGAWAWQQAEPPPPELARTHLQLLAWRRGCPDLQRLWRSQGCDSPHLDPFGVLWRFPGLAREPPPAAPDAGTPPARHLPSPAAVAGQAARIAGWRSAAAARMARPWSAAASEEAHAQLREELAASRSGRTEAGAGPAGAVEAAEPSACRPRRGAAPGPGSRPGESAAGGGAGRAADAAEAAGAAGRAVAMAAGAALHRALELWDLEAAPAREAERQRDLLPAYLSAVAAGEDVERAQERSRSLLERFAAGGLAARLHGLAAQVLAREMPVLLPPDPSAASAEVPGPVAVVSGTVDLLYRDAGSGELVIADYKTDEVAGAELARRAAVYASQGAAYVRAVQQALDLAAPPRFELWFVHAGRVVPAPLS
jgi:ATP-dependent exoDNAse (exonuclease V) beta subunit